MGGALHAFTSGLGEIDSVEFLSEGVWASLLRGVGGVFGAGAAVNPRGAGALGLVSDIPFRIGRGGGALPACSSRLREIDGTEFLGEGGRASLCGWGGRRVRVVRLAGNFRLALLAC